MQILVAANTFPWPEVSGARIRLSNILRALGRVGEIDFFTTANRDRDPTYPIPPEIPIRRVKTVAKPEPHLPLFGRLRWLINGTLPIEFAAREFGDVRSALLSWARDRYDLVWVSRAESYLAIGPRSFGPTIVDFDDLEDWKSTMRSKVRTPIGARSFQPLRGAWHAVTTTERRKNMLAWQRLQLEIADSADAVVVCSDLDRKRLGVSNLHVIPNGYTYQARPVGRTMTGSPPRILLPGFFHYLPNIDAATYLVSRIAPLIWKQMPAVEFRLVGDADPRVWALHQPPRITVTGLVPDIERELAGADLVVVPMRFGGGTRIKILEAFAHRVPVVSTSIGAEGLEVRDGQELLIANSPAEFAAACIRLLAELPWREKVVEAGHRLFAHRYRWDVIHETIIALAKQVAIGAQKSRDTAATSANTMLK